jgi:hypothetical protein
MAADFWHEDGRVQFECTADPHNPAAATAHGRYHVSRSQPGLDLDAISDVSIIGASAAFHVLITAEVKVNGQPYFSRRWSESIPRHLL